MARLDPISRLTRCLDTPVVATGRIAPPRTWANPNTAARGFDFAEQAAPAALDAPAPTTDAEAAHFQDLLQAAHYRMFPPHLYPPLRSAPYILRAAHRGWHQNNQRFTARVLVWVCPAGMAFAVQELHLRAATNWSPCRFGLRVIRNEQVAFDGDELHTRNPDGSESVQPEVFSIADNEPAAVMTSPFALNILPGERVALDLSGTPAWDASITAQIQLRGYTYPAELMR